MGEIIRISGPVVIAEGMEGSEMYDMARVGDEGLTGEIIELVEDRATIQVYEETSGLEPGEKAETTGHPLSLELGPGLISTVYDGIQRPLTVIQEQVGSFIERGVKADALPRDKKWPFTPTEMKEGTEVQSGDILGSVTESGLVEHKIMVPPNVEGKLSEMAGEGEYKVTDRIAKISTEDGDVDVDMIQEWPVRRARPYEDKLAPEIPLISGQRVIDILFPVAKGGTASIPGGFGTGKCVTGDTRVILADGRLIEIKDLYEKAIQSESLIYCDGGLESYIHCDEPIHVMSLDQDRLSPTPTNVLYETHVPRTVKIHTRTGRTARTTPNHKFRVLRPDWTISKVRADELTRGDRVTVPRRIKINGKSIHINLLELADDFKLYLADEESINSFSKVLRKLRDEKGSLKPIAEEAEVSDTTLYNYMAKRYAPPLSTVKKVLEIAQVNFSDFKIRQVKGSAESKTIRVPEKLCGDLAELIGLLMSDGYIGKNFIEFFSEDPSILERFQELVKKIFNIGCRDYRDSREKRVHSRALPRFISRLLELRPGAKTHIAKVPDILMTGDDKVLAGFLRGYFYGDGSVDKHSIYFPSVSKNMAKTVSYLLSRLGIFHKIIQRNENNKVIIPGKHNLQRFIEIVSPSKAVQKTQRLLRHISSTSYGRTSLDAVPLEPSLFKKLLKNQWKTLKEAKIHVHDYMASHQIPNNKFQSFIELLGSFNHHHPEMEERGKRIANMLDEVFFDEVKEVEIIEEPQQVYDFHIPTTHNFLGGEMGSFIHSNTVMLHQMAKWADTQIVVYVGCGERGNEMTDVLLHFPELEDPESGKPLMDRTVLIANTSNMPVAAREASIYTGITIAEYFRDMGYDIALQADSTSRWAEALREISGRLEEMPSEEGFPAYLASRLAEFYERAGRVVTLGSEKRIGSVTVMGAVSPPGGDFSEPVTQNTLRIIKTFWGLDTDLADRRHFPAIHWLTSYSLYLDSIQDWWEKEIGEEWRKYRDKAISILQKESELREIVRLVGPDALPDRDRAVLEAAKVIREDFLQQNAMHEVDTYCPVNKQLDLFKIVLKFHDRSLEAIENGAPIDEIVEVPVKSEIARLKALPLKKFEKRADEINRQIDSQFENLIEGA